jgi:hypothetical protein
MIIVTSILQDYDIIIIYSKYILRSSNITETVPLFLTDFKKRKALYVFLFYPKPASVYEEFDDSGRRERCM